MKNNERKEENIVCKKFESIFILFIIMMEMKWQQNNQLKRKRETKKTYTLY